MDYLAIVGSDERRASCVHQRPAVPRDNGGSRGRSRLCGRNRGNGAYAGILRQRAKHKEEILRLDAILFHFQGTVKVRAMPRKKLAGPVAHACTAYKKR